MTGPDINVGSNSPETAGRPLRREVTIVNPQGLHMRPAAAFAETASRFEARVMVSRDGGEAVDGKFWPDLMLLAAEQGAKLLLEADGRDARDALDALTRVLAMIFDDDASPDGPIN